MGCDLCIYVPKNGKEDCGMAYSTFNRVRTSIIQLYLEKKKVEVDLEDNEVFPLSMGIVTDSLVQRVADALGNIDSPEADSMRVLWEHCDCDGTYWSEDCKYIAKGIKMVLDMFDEEDDDKSWAEALMELFEAAGKNEGIVVVC